MLTIRSIVEKHAHKQGKSPFLIDGEKGTAFSYATLHKEIVEIGKYLDSFSLVKGDKIAFLMDNGPFTAFLFLAIAYHGFVIVPVNAVAGKAQIEYILSHSDTRLLFVSSHYQEKMKEIIDTFRSKIKIIDTDETVGFSKTNISDNRAVQKPNQIDEDTDALLIYTSGTTGRPKGVVLTHKNMIAGGRNTTLAHELRKEDRAFCVLPLYHINGQIVTVMAPLVSGSSVVMPRKFSPSSFWKLIHKYECSWFSVVPTIISYLLNNIKNKDFDKANVSKVLFGRSASAPLTKELHIKFEKTFGVTMIETMGLSETAAPILSNPRDKSKIKYGSPGIPYGNKVDIIDEENKFLGANEIGEIVIKGDNVMKEYYKNPLETSKAFVNGSWFRSGDLGRKDEDGFFYVTGRKKELIIKGGENISPREIDDVLYQYPGILETSAFGVVSKDYGEEVLACVYPAPDTVIDIDKLKSFCTECLDKFKVPKDIIISKEPLPKGPSGKIQRLKIASKYKDYLKNKS